MIKPERDSAGSVGQNRPESSSSAEQLDSPDREVLQLGSSVECTSPAPTSATYNTASAAAGWSGMDYDPTQVAWDEPESEAYNGYEEQTTTAGNEYGAQPANDGTTEPAQGEQNYEEGYEKGYETVLDGSVGMTGIFPSRPFNASPSLGSLWLASSVLYCTPTKDKEKMIFQLWSKKSFQVYSILFYSIQLVTYLMNYLLYFSD